MARTAIDGFRPEPGRIGVEAQDDLGLARRDERRQPVSETRTGRRLDER